MKKIKDVNFQQGFNDYVKDHGKVFAHDRSTTVGASEVFGCMRENVFKKRYPELAELAEEEDPEWGHAKRGDVIENAFVVPVLINMFGEKNCHMMGEDQKTLVDGRLSATPDGAVTGLDSAALSMYNISDLGEDGHIAAEVKTFGGDFAAPRRTKNDDGTVSYAARVKHVGQNICQMGLMKLRTNFNPNYGVVLYVNPVNLKDVRPAPVAFDQNVYDAAKERAEDVFDMTKGLADYPAEGRATGDCTYCEFCAKCQTIEMDRYNEADTEHDALKAELIKKIDHQAAEVYNIRAEFKDMEKTKKVAESNLRELLLSTGVTKTPTASLVKYKGRKTLDKVRIAEEFDISLDEYTTTGADYLVLKVKGE
jgi:hypothetical protein